MQTPPVKYRPDEDPKTNHPRKHTAPPGPCGTDLREEERQPVNTTCVLYVFEGSKPTITQVPAVTQNLSFRGVSVISHVPHPLRIGQSAEAAVTFPNDDPFYLAGTIAYCQQVGDHQYELGIRVQAAGRAPILLNNPEQARKLYDWFADTLQPDPQP